MFPITHGLIGWSVSQPLKHRKDRIVVTIASLSPDFDGAGAIISIDYYSAYHHVFGHNLVFGLLLSAGAFFYCRQRFKAMLLVFISFHSHILGDLLGSGEGWGIPYFWPLYEKKFEFAPPFQWELDSPQNLLVTFLCIVYVIICAIRKDRTIVEVFSKKADKLVVGVFKEWFDRTEKKEDES